ncbi:MAG: PKD domain-containing protein [Chlorobi bacterium]|nr:PKD domain-containing protein [Chlorobiota bacterium]
MYKGGIFSFLAVVFSLLNPVIAQRNVVGYAMKPLPTLTLPNSTQNNSSNSQSNYVRCATDEYDAWKRSNDPQFDAMRRQFIQAFDMWLQNMDLSRLQQNVVYTIPVVVHVVYNTPSQNPTDAQIQAMIDAVNKDLRRLNSDTSNTPSVWKSIAADFQIELCLAQQDPWGNPTTGIERRQTSVSSFSANNNDIKFFSTGGLDAWDPTRYFNIWIGPLGGGLLGYAEFPSGTVITSSHTTYGVVVEYCTVTGTCAPYNLYRTLTHEIGHCLNLYHIWGDDFGACTGDDQCQDTPNQAQETTGCPTFPQTDACSPTYPGIMFMNYMDYSDDACMNLFTQDQKARALAVVTNFLLPLLSSNACQPPATNQPPVANFYGIPTTIYAGQSVNFFDQSLYSPTSWTWSFPGGTPATSTAQNPSNIVYNTPGTYDVILVACNAFGCDTMTKQNYITVLPIPSCVTIANIDTFPIDTPILYVTNCDGTGPLSYVSGHNCYQDIGKMDFFSSSSLSGFNYITAVAIAFGVGKDGGNGNSINVTVWDSNRNVLASVPVPYSKIKQDVDSGRVTIVPLPNPIPIPPNGVYAGITFTYSSGDTVAILTNKHNNSPAPGTAWEIWSDGSWHVYGDATNSWGLNVSHYIWLFATSGLPNASFTPIRDTICEGETVTFDASASSNSSEFYWSLPGSSMPSAQGVTVATSYPNAGTYDVQLVVGNACFAYDTLFVPNAIIVNPKPTISINPANPVICTGQSVTLTASGAQSYTWSPSTGLNTTTGSMVVASPSSTTTYTVVGTSAEGCTNLAYVTVTVTDQYPVPNIQVISDTSVLCASDTIILDASGSQFVQNWTWDIPGVASSTSTDAIVPVVFPSQGIYTVTLTVENGCGTTQDTIVLNIKACYTGIEDAKENLIVTTMQNKVIITTSQLYRLTITDPVGRMIAERELPAGKHSIQLSPGLYFIQLTDKQLNHTTIKKVLLME